MTDIIQELRGIIDAAKLPWEVVPGPDYSELVDALGNKVALTTYTETILPAIHALPALLDRLEAAEPWRKHYFDMAKAAGDLKAAVRPQLDAMPFADHAEVRKAFNDIAIVAGRALDHMQPKDAPAIWEVKL